MSKQHLLMTTRDLSHQTEEPVYNVQYWLAARHSALQYTYCAFGELVVRELYGPAAVLTSLHTRQDKLNA